MDIAATSGEFNADMFAMANATSFENVAEYEDYFTEHLTIDATEHTVKLARKAIENSIYINGLEQASEAGAGKYVVTDSSDDPAVTLITFDASETGEIEVSYRAMIADVPVAMIDNKTTAIGEAVCKWPVYDNGDDCSVSGIRGYVVLRMFKCRVTQLPGFDTSYKSPATNSVTFSAMDPERDDEKVYSVAFVPKAKMTL